MNEFENGLLKYLTQAQLHKIQKTKVGIAGCGGLGSNIANALVRTGFKDFEILDNDKVEANNLNRQNFFLDEVGDKKVDATAKRMKQINPEVKVKIFKTYLTNDNILDFFSDRNVVFEAFDNTDSKKLILETFGDSGKLLIMGSGMAGISNKTPIDVRKVKEKIYIVGDETTNVGKESPPLAPRVIACAAMMASVAVEIILTK